MTEMLGQQGDLPPPDTAGDADGAVNGPSGPVGEATGRRVGVLFAPDWLKALIVMLTLLVGLALIWVVWQIVSPILHTLVLFGLASALAFMLRRPVEMLSRRGIQRAVATLTVYAVLGALVVGAVVLVAGPFVTQADALSTAVPTYESGFEVGVAELQSWLEDNRIPIDISQLENRGTAALEQASSEALRNLASGVAQVSGTVSDVFLTLIISVYLLVDGPGLAQRATTLIPLQQRPKWRFVQETVARVMGGYLRGQLTLALIVGLAAGLGTAALGLPYALVLGVLAGLFELVPMFGPVLSAIPALTVALFMPFPTIVWVLLLFIIIQQLENNVLAPRISGQAVGIHPLAVLFALLAGFQIAGLLGAIFAVPLAGILWELLGAVYRESTPGHQNVNRS